MEKKIVGLNTYFKSLEYENFDEYEFSARISLLVMMRLLTCRVFDNMLFYFL